MKIAYIVSDLKRVGPSNQTLNIINNSVYKRDSIVITLFKEPDDTMIEEYKEKDIRVICLELGRISFSINGVKKLVNILKDYNIDIIHSYGIKADTLCQKVSKKLDILHIITLRNYPKEDILTRMNWLKGRIALINHLHVLLNCKNVICCSKTICDKMIDDYPNKKFDYIQNGVDTEKFRIINSDKKNELRKKNGLMINYTIFISTGSFISRKRIEETIEGFLKSNRKNSILLLLGDGYLYNTIKDKYGKNRNLLFVGKTDLVSEYLSLSDVFISSSESEGLPNGVIEAIASGLPVILSDIPQHKEIVDNVKNSGILYKLGNVEELSKIISNEDFNQYKGEIIDSPFTMKNMSKKYCEYYDLMMKVKKE